MIKKFPAELLDKSAHEKLAYFYNYRGRHPVLDEVEKQLTRCIYHPYPEEIPLLVGPTGVGKSTVLDFKAKEIIRDDLQNLIDNPGRLSVLMVKAPAPENGGFVFKDFNCRLLNAANEPMVNKKLRDDFVVDERVTSHELRRAVEAMVRNRQPRVVMIDEADRILAPGTGRTLVNQIECIKHDRQEFKTSLLLSGTYALLALMGLNTQFSRRITPIHFRRYDGRVPKDREAFLNLLMTLVHRMPLKKMPDLINNEAYIFSRSIGCAGLLKDWLFRALRTAVEQNAETITIEDLEREQLPEKELQVLAEHALNGETEMKKQSEASVLLDSLVSYEEPSTKPLTSSFSQNAPSKKGNRKPGVRNPKRDDVGYSDVGEAYV
ncbi:TniB family NTP-binding protein [Geotalea sp. SG265]|uniref:TniB family NTP-binding protein n=1 Tax=Geotalea sp. SG265 TaxID=2922867 RepID=UPI001FAFCCF4|nr:TniB family NTP-binding protein [Geotalea sp. SG265]